MSTELEISAECDDGICVVRLSGTLDLSLGDRRLVPDDARQVVFDFAGVRRVTSFGILMWSRALEPLSLDYMAMWRCRPCVVQQLNVIKDFAGKCEVISVYLPYACEHCDKEFDVLWDLHEKHALAQKRDVGKEKCPKCGRLSDFDDMPQSYLTFADRVPAPRTPASVNARLLAARMDDASRGVTRGGEKLRDRAAPRDEDTSAKASATLATGRGQNG